MCNRKRISGRKYLCAVFCINPINYEVCKMIGRIMCRVRADRLLRSFGMFTIIFSLVLLLLSVCTGSSRAEILAAAGSEGESGVTKTVDVKEGCVATLSSGATVELIAVSNLQWQSKRQKEMGIKRKNGWRSGYWWKPDGTLIEKVDFRRGKFVARNERNFEFVVSVAGLDEYHIIATHPGKPPLNWVLVHSVKNRTERVIPNTSVLSVPDFPYPLEQTSLRVGLSTGPWEDVESWEWQWARYDLDNTIMTTKSGVVFPWPRQKGSDVEFLLTHIYTDSVVRLIAVDQNGNTHQAEVEKGGDGVGLTRCICRFRDLEFKDIKKVVFQKKAYDQWVEFHNVVLGPDHAAHLWKGGRLKTLSGKQAPRLQQIKDWKNGGPLELTDLKGKVVLLDFWHYRCPPCLAAMPELMKLHDEYKDRGLVVIGIHADIIDSIADMDAKLAKVRKKNWGGRDIPFLVALDGGGKMQIQGTKQKTDGATTASYGVTSFPTTVLIDKEGRVMQEFFLRAEGAKEELERILGMH